MSILTFIIGIAVLFVILKIISLPMKLIIRFVINAIVGGVILYALSFVGIGIAITNISALIVGIFGIPGLILVAILQLVFKIVI